MKEDVNIIGRNQRKTCWYVDSVLACIRPQVMLSSFHYSAVEDLSAHLTPQTGYPVNVELK